MKSRVRLAHSPMHAQLTSRSSVAGRSIAVLLTAASLLLIDVPPAHPVAGTATSDRPGNEPHSRIFRGMVSANGTAVQGATVRLLQAGAAPGTAQLLLTTTTDRFGSFALHVPPNVVHRDVLYITSRGGRFGKRRLPRKVELATSQTCVPVSSSSTSSRRLPRDTRSPSSRRVAPWEA